MNGWKQSGVSPAQKPVQHGAPPQMQGSPTSQSPAEYVQNRLSGRGCTRVQVKPDTANPSQYVVQLVFNNAQDAAAFKKVSGGNTPTSSDGKTLILGPTRAAQVFKTLGMEYYGKTHPVPIMQALVNSVQPMNPPQSPKTSQSPAEYVQSKLSGHGCSKVQIKPDSANPSQYVVQLVFNSAQEAAAFKKISGGTTPTSSDGKTLTLGPTRAPQVFKSLGIEHYGKTHPVPIMQALINSAQPMKPQPPVNPIHQAVKPGVSPPVQAPTLKDATFYTVNLQRLVIKDNAIVGYQNWDVKQNGWKNNNDVSQFNKLIHDFKEIQNIKDSFYKYASYSNETNRSYQFSVSSEKYHDLKGDFLKTKILQTLKSELTTYAQNCSSKQDFDVYVNNMKTNNHDYKILEKAQRIVSLVTGRETSSVKAFNKIVESIEKDVFANKGPQCPL